MSYSSEFRGVLRGVASYRMAMADLRQQRKSTGSSMFMSSLIRFAKRFLFSQNLLDEGEGMLGGRGGRKKGGKYYDQFIERCIMLEGYIDLCEEDTNHHSEDAVNIVGYVISVARFWLADEAENGNRCHWLSLPQKKFFSTASALPRGEGREKTLKMANKIVDVMQEDL